MADRVGAALSLLVAVLWWSACTALTAAGRGFLSLLGLRMLLGVGEAGAYPSFAKVAASWFPRGERSFASSIFDSGSRVGSALAIPLVSWVIATLGWRESFVVTGVLGFVWAVFWMWLYREPENHPAVTPAELAALRAAQDRPKAVDAADAQNQVPWLSLFRYRTVWGMMAGFFCLNFVIYFFITWFPTYLVKARGFSLAELGTLGSLPGPRLDPGGLARRLRLGRALSPGLEPHGGAQDLPGRRHADVLGDHPVDHRARTSTWPCCASPWPTAASPSRPPRSGHFPATWRRRPPMWPRSAASRTSPPTSPAS